MISSAVLVRAAGITLLLVGIVLTTLQYFGVGRGSKKPSVRKASIRGVSVTTTYPGIVLIALGIGLLLAGTLLGK